MLGDRIVKGKSKRGEPGCHLKYVRGNQTICEGRWAGKEVTDMLREQGGKICLGTSGNARRSQVQSLIRMKKRGRRIQTETLHSSS